MYAFHNPDGGSCYAKDGLTTGRPEIPISVPETASADAVYATGYTEVSSSFKKWFIQGFVLSCAVILYSFLAYAYLLMDKEQIAMTAEVLGCLTQLCTIVWLIHGAYIRWNHVGRVCSGAFVDGSDAIVKEPPY